MLLEGKKTVERELKVERTRETSLFRNSFLILAPGSTTQRKKTKIEGVQLASLSDTPAGLIAGP